MDDQKNIKRENEEEWDDYKDILERWLILADHVIYEEENDDDDDGKKEKEKNDHASNVLEEDLEMSMDFFEETIKCVRLMKWEK